MQMVEAFAEVLSRY